MVRRVFFPENGGPPEFSAFSSITEIIAPYPRLEGNTMDPFVTSQTLLGIGPQSFGEPHDTARRPHYVVEYTQGNMKAELLTIVSHALKNTTARRNKAAAGPASFPGSFPFEMTPNGPIARFLSTLLGAPTTIVLGGQTIALTAAVTVSATSLAVSALASAVPSGSFLTFTIARTATTNADSALGATTLHVAALPGAVAINTVLHYAGYYFRATAGAAASATSITVTPLPVDIPTAQSVTYSESASYTTTAIANAAATTISISAAGTAIGATATSAFGGKFKHTWLNTSAYNPATIVQYIGQWVRVHPGVVGNTFELEVDKEQETFLTPTVAVRGLNQLNRYTITGSGLDAALTDNLDGFSPLDAILVINGVESDEARSATFSMNRNLKAKNVLNRLRGATRNFPTITDANMSAKLYFSDEDLMATYFGQATPPSSQYGATRDLQVMTLSLEMATEPIGTDLPYEFKIQFPQCVMETVDDPVTGQGDEIYQEVNFLPQYDLGTGSDLIIVLVSDESHDDIMTPNAIISPIPVNLVTSYTA